MNRKNHTFILTAIFLLLSFSLTACQQNQPSIQSAESKTKNGTPATPFTENTPAKKENVPASLIDDGGVNQVNNAVCCNISGFYQDYVYYADRDGLYQTNLSFKKHKKIADVCARTLLFCDNHLYFVNISDNCKLYRLNLKDFQLYKLMDFHIGNFQIIGENLYFSNFDNHLSLCRYSLNSGQVDELLPNVEAECLLVNQNELYYVNWNWGGDLERLTAKNKAEKVGPSPVSYINADKQGNLYYNYDGVYRFLSGTKDFIKIYDDTPVFYINVFQNQIYFQIPVTIQNSSHLHIYKMDTDGQNVVPIIKEHFEPFDVISPDVLLAQKEDKGDVYLIRKAEGSEEYTVTLMQDLRE